MTKSSFTLSSNSLWITMEIVRYPTVAIVIEDVVTRWGISDYPSQFVYSTWRHHNYSVGAWLALVSDDSSRISFRNTNSCIPDNINFTSTSLALLWSVRSQISDVMVIGALALGFFTVFAVCVTIVTIIVVVRKRRRPTQCKTCLRDTLISVCSSYLH